MDLEERRQGCIENNDVEKKRTWLCCERNRKQKRNTRIVNSQWDKVK